MHSLISLALFAVGFVCFAAFSWGIKFHFRHTERIPFGTYVISVLTVTGFLWFAWRILARGPSRLWELALPLFILSLALFAWTVRATRNSRPTMVFDTDAPSFLLHHGPFRYVRHPFYLSYLLFWIATALATGGLLPWAAPLLMLAVYWTAARREERKFANSALASAYRTYRAKVGMFLPLACFARARLRLPNKPGGGPATAQFRLGGRLEKVIPDIFAMICAFLSCTIPVVPSSHPAPHPPAAPATSANRAHGAAVSGHGAAVSWRGGAISWQFQTCVALGLLLIVLITRLPTFFRSVMDWDESLYFLMAEQWRAGHLPYTAIWDNKPIGIYGVFALFQSWFGDTIISIRIASVLFITVTAFAIFKIVLKIPAGRYRVESALFASLAYVICSLTNDGLSANTEIFMACFTALAVLSALSKQALLAGLLFGMAFMTKYVAVFEFPALAFAVLALNPPPRLQTAIRAGLALLTGAALPLGLTVMLYAGSGHLHSWLEDSILSNFRRIDVTVSMPALTYAFEIELARWSPLFLISAIMLVMAARRIPHAIARKTLSPAASFNIFLALWLVGGCIGVASAKSFFDHYFLQILPVMCVTLAWLPLNLAFTRRLSKRPVLLLCAAVLALPLAAAATAVSQAATPILALSNGHFSLQRDTPARIAHEIQPLLTSRATSEASGEAAGQLFVFDYQPIIYSLDRQRPPTKYPFPSVLTRCQLARVAKAPAMHEIMRILATNPEFIIRSRYPYQDPSIVNLRVYAAVDRTLAARYQIWRTYNDAVVYRLRSPNAPVDDSFENLPAACPAR